MISPTLYFSIIFALSSFLNDEIISSFKKEDKAKIIEKYKVGDIIKGAEVKGYSTFGCSLM